MKQFVFIAFVVVITVAASNAAEQYTNRFDNINVDQILSNDRILNNYVKCLLEKGPCTQEGRELKKSLPDAFRTNCVKCTETQRRNARKVIFHLQDNKKADYAKLVEKYDPEGIYRSQWDNQNHQA